MYGIEYGITYNETKSACVAFFQRHCDHNNNIGIYLNGAELEIVQKVKHWICGLH